jgi:hypothetical protein
MKLKSLKSFEVLGIEKISYISAGTNNPSKRHDSTSADCTKKGDRHDAPVC